MNIIVFGAGDDGRKAVPFLEKEHRILFFVDNNEKKYGSTIGKYRIKPVEEVRKCGCVIVIASMRYGYEISEQLQQEGISKDRLYFFGRKLVGNRQEGVLAPVDAEKVQSTDLPLIQYDLLHIEEKETTSRKVLIFCTFFSTYTKQLMEHMSKRYQDIEFSLLTKADEYREKLKMDRLKHIYCFQTMEELKTILMQLPVYDAMQLLWIEREWAYFYKLIREKTKRLNINVGGSDFYRACENERQFKGYLLDCADVITAETETTVQEFGDYYGEKVKDKLALLPFGIEVLEWIDYYRATDEKVLRKKYHIPSDKIIVTCGHNAIEEHQHMEIIEAMERLPERILAELFFVFPMTYPRGRGHYIQRVGARLQRSGLDYVVLTQFMNFAKMAEYALISDIMIHVQKTDQLSSTMLEEMYAGSIITAGGWLPYQSLHQLGMFFLDIDHISALPEMIEEIVTNMETYRGKCIKNKKLIREHSSWEALAPKWNALWV